MWNKIGTSQDSKPKTLARATHNQYNNSSGHNQHPLPHHNHNHSEPALSAKLLATQPNLATDMRHHLRQIVIE